MVPGIGINLADDQTPFCVGTGGPAQSQYGGVRLCPCDSPAFGPGLPWEIWRTCLLRLRRSDVDACSLLMMVQALVSGRAV